MRVELLKDVVSSFGKNKKVYGSKGEKLLVLTERLDNVLLVKGKKEHFTVSLNEVKIIN